jgi:hypothetical protein
MKARNVLLALLLLSLPVLGAYTQVYNSTEVGWAVQDTVGAFFDALAQYAGLIIVVVVGMFAIGGVAVILAKAKSMGH